MKRTRKGVAPQHNGSRVYLANEVKAQREDITDLSEKVSGIDKRVEGQTVALTTLIESDRRAREHRDKIWGAINAMRAEQQQVMLAQAGTPGAIDRLATAVENQGKKLSDIETDRQQAKGMFSVASAGAKVAWGMLIGLFFALAAGIMAAIRYLALMPPAPPPPGHP